MANSGLPGKSGPTVPSRHLLQPSIYNNTYINFTPLNMIYPTFLNVHFLVVFLSNPFRHASTYPRHFRPARDEFVGTIDRISKGFPLDT